MYACLSISCNFPWVVPVYGLKSFAHQCIHNFLLDCERVLSKLAIFSEGSLKELSKMERGDVLCLWSRSNYVLLNVFLRIVKWVNFKAVIFASFILLTIRGRTKQTNPNLLMLYKKYHCCWCMLSIYFMALYLIL